MVTNLSHLSRYNLPLCLIIRGPLGVGKTTIAKKLAPLYSAQYFSVDQILKELELDTIEGTNISLVNFLKCNKYIFDSITDLNANIIIDGNFYYQEQIDDLLQKLREYKTFVFTLTSSLQTCIERDRQRIPSYGSKAVEAVFSLVSAFDFGAVIHTDGLRQDDVVKLITRGNVYTAT